MKKIFSIVLIGIVLTSLVSCKSQTPYIGDNGNWWIGHKDLGVTAWEQDRIYTEFVPGDKLTTSLVMPLSFPLSTTQTIVIQEINVVKSEILDMNDFDDYVYGDWGDSATFYQYKYTISVKGKADTSQADRYLRIQLYFDGTMSNVKTYFDGNLLENPGGMSGSYRSDTNKTILSGCVFKVERDGSFSTNVVGYSNENLSQYSISSIGSVN